MVRTTLPKLPKCLEEAIFPTLMTQLVQQNRGLQLSDTNGEWGMTTIRANLGHLKRSSLTSRRPFHPGVNCLLAMNLIRLTDRIYDVKTSV